MHNVNVQGKDIPVFKQMVTCILHRYVRIFN